MVSSGLEWFPMLFLWFFHGFPMVSVVVSWGGASRGPGFPSAQDLRRCDPDAPAGQERRQWLGYIGKWLGI